MKTREDNGFEMNEQNIENGSTNMNINYC